METNLVEGGKKYRFMNRKQVKLSGLLVLCTVLAIWMGFLLATAIAYALLAILYTWVYFTMEPEVDVDLKFRRCRRLIVFFTMGSATMFTVFLLRH